MGRRRSESAWDKWRERLEGPPAYGSWRGMHERCGNPSNENYENYGGRGITVCERWFSYANFFADMGPPPSPEHSLDRRDNNDNYEPGNCRWATPKQQYDNRRPPEEWPWRIRQIARLGLLGRGA